MAQAVRAEVTPKTKADRAIGEWICLWAGETERCAKQHSMRTNFILIFTFHFLATLSPLSTASDWDRMKDIQPHGYVCSKAAGPIQIDGDLRERSWQAAPWTSYFADIEGVNKTKPRFRTRAKMTWDDQYFYIAAELEEPHVNATLTQHDSVIFQDNDFEVFIDPNGDNHEYYEIEINALNTEWDLFLKKPYKDGGKALDSWEIPGLKTAVRIQGTLNDPRDIDKGWSVEIAIPWKVMAEHAHRSTPPKEGDQWRVNFSRVEWLYEISEGKYRKVPDKKEDNWVWSPQGIIDMHRPEKWGYVQFTSSAAGKVRFKADPSASVRDVLHEIYHAQREFHEKQKQWAASLKILGLSDFAKQKLISPPAIEITPEGFKATAEIKLPVGTTQRWHITQDSHIWTK